MLARGVGVTTRMVRWWMEDAYEAALVRWHKEMRPKHFRESGKSEYSYASRTREYEESKRKGEGHTRPLAYSGESERATERVVLRITSRSGKASMDAGNLSFTPKRSRINMREELTTVTTREEAVLGRTFDRVMDIKMRRHDDFMNRTIR